MFVYYISLLPYLSSLHFIKSRYLFNRSLYLFIKSPYLLALFIYLLERFIYLKLLVTITNDVNTDACSFGISDQFSQELMIL